MKQLSVSLSLFATLIISCNHSKAPDLGPNYRVKFEQSLEIVGTEFENAEVVVGQVPGAANLLIYRNVNQEIDEWRVRANYMVFLPYSGVSEVFTEDGGLKNFRFEKETLFGAKRLSADWSPAGSGSGVFTIAIIKNDNEDYVCYVGIKGDNFNYYDNVQLDSQTLAKMVEILDGKTSLIDEEQKKPLQNDSAQIMDSSTTANEIISYQEDEIVDEFLCTTNFLKLREDSSLESKVLEHIRINAVLQNLHNQSNRKDTITINGITSIEPWYNVKSEKGNIGWVHGCCIELRK
jgi:hypothetical protein